MSGGASFWGGNGVGFPNSIDMANVQAPVQEVLLVLTKASHACAGSLEKLDLKVDRQTSKEFIWGMLEEFLQSREDKENRRNHNEGNIAASATELKLQSAVITSLEDKLHDSHVQISRMNEIMQHQSAAITDLNRRLETVMAEVQDVAQRPPPSDAHLLAHLDKQMNRHRADVDKRLASQAEREAVEHLSQARVEELLRSLSNQVADLRMEVDRKATKEQFHALSDGKVDSKEHLELLATVHEKISMTQLTSSVNNQVRPLVMAMAALEKAVVIQDVTIKRAGGASSLSVQDHMDRKMGPAWDAAKSASDGASDGASRALDVHKITDLVESILKSYRIGEVTQIGLEKALAQQHDSLLREVGAAVDNVRSEVVGVNRERMAGLQRHLEGRLSEAFRAVDTSRQKIQQQTQQREQSEQQTLACIRELAGSTTKALQKKADMSDLKSEIKKLTSMVDERTEAILASEHSRVAELDAFFDASDRTPQRGVNAESSPIRPVRLAAPAPAPSSARGSRIPAWTPRKSQALEAIGALEHMDREAEKLRKSLADFKTRAEKAEVEAAALKTALELKTVALSAVEARRHPASHYASPAGASPPSSSSSSNAVNTEWRLALGELGASLRRELDNKMNRGDFQGMLSPDILRLDGAVKELQREVAAKSESADLGKLSNSFSTLQSRVISELTGGLWLWTSRQLIGDDCVVPWDAQVVNAAPASLLWRQGSGMITVRLPGLYRLSIAVFTSLPVKLTLFLNDEPLLLLQPDTAAAPEAFSMSAYFNAQAHRDEKYTTRRLRHSAGDVSAVSIDEPLSLPADAVLSVRFHSAGANSAQALLSLRKL